MIESNIDKEHIPKFILIFSRLTYLVADERLSLQFCPNIYKRVKPYLTVSPLNKNEPQNSNKNAGEHWDIDALNGITRRSPTLPKCLKCAVVRFENWIVQVGCCV